MKDSKLHDDLEKLDLLKKRICFRYMLLIIATFSFFSVYYIYNNIYPLDFIITICLIVHICYLYIPYKLDYKSIKPLIPLYLVFLTIALYINNIFFWHFGQITVFLWHMVIPVAVAVFFNRKTIIMWIICMFILFFSVFFVSPLTFIPENLIQLESPTEEEFEVINMVSIITSLNLICFFIYYLNRISVMEHLQLKKYEMILQTEEEEKDENENNILKFNALYAQIIKIVSDKESFRNPDLTISDLAIQLDSNVKYIAKAIKINSGMNFNMFINTYRINKIKDMLNNNYQNRYTIQYIYTFAGFRNQSTFNKAFKQIEGITPSEYIKDLHKGMENK